MKYGSGAWEFDSNDFVNVLKDAAVVATGAVSVWFTDYVGSLDLSSGESIGALFVLSTIYSAVRRWSQNYR